MNSHIVRITKNLSFDDLYSKRVSPIEAYRTQVTDWIINPAKMLAETSPRNTDHGMAILALELMFFEPHGQYLTGKDSKGNSGETFRGAFDKFQKFICTNHQQAEFIEPESVWTWARNRLFHSTRLSNPLLVNAVGIGRNAIQKNPDFEDGWLIDPWRLIDLIEEYLENYISIITQNKNEDLSKNFHVTFDRLLGEAMRYFSK